MRIEEADKGGRKTADMDWGMGEGKERCLEKSVSVRGEGKDTGRMYCIKT